MIFKFGTSYTFDNKFITILMDIKSPVYNFDVRNTDVSYGVEAHPSENISVRAGIQIPVRVNDLGFFNLLSFGFGLNFKYFILDYSIRNFSDLGLTHCIAGTLKFDAEVEKKNNFLKE